jgi:DNA-binding transcriptional MerR regulator
MENAKRYFAISELAKEFDVSKRHIRFCEEKGLISPKVTKLSRRIYSSYDHARLKLIFHCVLIGYSQDQIVELIGMPDADLDEADQIKKGLAYAERMIEELEKRRNELSFHQRTSVINEIKMLGEYIKEIKAIPLETLEKSAAKLRIPDKESKDKAHKAVEEIKPGVEQKPGRQPARMVHLYIAGLAIVLIIGGFFYYQSSKKDSKSIYLVQKEPAKTETQPVYHDRVPIDKIGKQEDLKPMSPESAAAEKAAAEKAVAEKAAAERAAAEKAAAEKAVAEKAAAERAAAKKAAAERAAAEKAAAEKAVAEKAAAERAAAEKAAAERAAAEKAAAEKAAADNAAAEKAAAEKAAAEKAAAEKAAAEKAAAEKAAAEKAAAEKAAAEKAAAEKAAAEKAAADKAAAETAAAEKAAAEKAAAAKAAAEKAAAAKAAAEKAAAKKALTPLVAEPGVEKQEVAKSEVKSVEIKKDVHAIPGATVAPVPSKTPPDPEKQETVSLSNLQASEVEVKEVTAIEESDVKEPLVPAETDKSVTQGPKAERPGVVEESQPSKPEKDKEMLASKEKILSQQDQKDRLESFLRIYCRAYESKDIDKFASLFTPDATENNTPFQDMLPNYRKNMENIESFNYRIELVDYFLQNDTGNIRMNGKYFTRFLLHEGAWEENNGSISMELITSGDSYLVKRLNYGN